MKKIIALFMAIAFSLSLGIAFANEAVTPAAAPEKKEEKAPVKKVAKKKVAAKKVAKKKVAKKKVVTTSSPEAAPAAN